MDRKTPSRSVAEKQVRMPGGFRTRVRSFEEWERKAQQKQLCVGECAEDHRQFRETQQREKEMAEKERMNAKLIRQEQEEQMLRMMPDDERAMYLAKLALQRMDHSLRMYKGTLRRAMDDMGMAQLIVQKQGRGAASAVAKAQNVDPERNVAKFVAERQYILDMNNIHNIQLLVDAVRYYQERERTYRQLLEYAISDNPSPSSRRAIQGAMPEDVILPENIQAMVDRSGST